MGQETVNADMIMGQEHYKQHDHLQYPEKTMYDMIEAMGAEYGTYPAFDFYGRKTSFADFVQKILRAARAFTDVGIVRDDAVTICMPNVPQAMVCFYALDRIGAASNMVHPLSAQNEITYYLNVSKSKMILTLDMFYEKVAAAVAQADHPVKILVARMQDELPAKLVIPYTLTKGREFLKLPKSGKGMLWTQFLQRGNRTISLPPSIFDRNHTAVILYSGGTTGTPKGICLTDYNFNALGLEAIDAIGVVFHAGIRMLSCMPLFHGFGLGINLHTILMHGACCVLLPTFTIKSYADTLIKKRPHFIAGVPTIFEALLHMPQLKNADLSFLVGMFCGGDSLSIELKKKVDEFLRAHHAGIQIREGYGLTECVTASCLTPKDDYRPGSIGLPFPDIEYAVVEPGTENLVPPGTEGELILRGPTVMLGYLNNEEETAKALRMMPDGKKWLFTGDLGHMDEDGFVYFHQRISRMIVTNGYNVYPGQIENELDKCREVSYSCVIGVKDRRRGKRIRAYVVLRDGMKGDEACKKRILDQLKLSVAAYALPKELIFRKELPKTLVGKVAYRKLEEEAAQETAN